MQAYGDAEMQRCRDAGMPRCHFPKLEPPEKLCRASAGPFAAGHARLQEPAPHLHRVQLLLWFGFAAACGKPWARLVFKASYRKVM